MAAVRVVLLYLIAAAVAGRAGDVIQIPKCCPFGESYSNQLNGCNSSDVPLELEISDGAPDKFEFVVGKKCGDGRSRFLMDPSKEGAKKFHFFSNGSLEDSWGFYYSPEDYCLENVMFPNGSAEVSGFYCFLDPEEDAGSGEEVTRLSLLVSIVFLLITIVIFLLIDELRTMAANILISYWLFLAVGYGFLYYIKLEGHAMTEFACKVMVFPLQFAFLSSYFWLNVFCFHTWRTVTARFVGKDKASEKRTLLRYATYAVGCPTAFIVFTLIMELASSHPLKPNIGITRCWFEDEIAHIIYFNGPATVVLAANLVFFVLTVCHLAADPRRVIELTPEVALPAGVSTRNQLFLEGLVIFFAMGLNWIMEEGPFYIVSILKLHIPIILDISDAINMLYGVIVFLVFVVQDPRVRRLVSGKLSSRRPYVEEGNRGSFNTDTV